MLASPQARIDFLREMSEDARHRPELNDRVIHLASYFLTEHPHCDILTERALAYHREDALLLARWDYSQALKINPHCPYATLGMAMVMEDRGLDGLAEKGYYKVLEIAEEDARDLESETSCAWLQLGVIALKKGKIQEAVALWDKIPQDSDYYKNFAQPVIEQWHLPLPVLGLGGQAMIRWRGGYHYRPGGVG